MKEIRKRGTKKKRGRGRKTRENIYKLNWVLLLLLLLLYLMSVNLPSVAERIAAESIDGPEPSEARATASKTAS